MERSPGERDARCSPSYGRSERQVAEKYPRHRRGRATNLWRMGCDTTCKLGMRAFCPPDLLRRHGPEVAARIGFPPFDTSLTWEMKLGTPHANTTHRKKRPAHRPGANQTNLGG